MAEQKIQRHELYDDGLEQHPQGTWVRYQDVDPILLAADALAKVDAECECVHPGHREGCWYPAFISARAAYLAAKAVSQ